MSVPSNPSSNTLSRAGLVILMCGQLLPLIDFSIVNVALASIAQSLGANHVELELMVAVYGVSFAVCLAMGGRLGDNYGRRKIFSIGVALFGLSSLSCGLSGSIYALLIARSVQGISAAFIVPQVLATLHVTLSGKRHSFAIGVYGAVAGLAFVIGQVLGGWLVSANVVGLGWRNVFLINIPVCVFILLCARFWVPENRADKASSIDWSGTFVLALSLLCLLLSLALGPLYDWSWPLQVMLILTVPLMFLLWKIEKIKEKKERSPLLPPHLLRLHSVRFSLILAVLMFSSWSGFMFSVALTLQSGLGLTPLESGNSFIVLGLTFFLGSLLSAKVSARFGTLQAMLGGCAIQITFLLGLIFTFYNYWPNINTYTLIPATSLIGFGQAFIVGSFFRIGLSEVEKKDAGAASAMLSTVMQASFGLGSALLGSIVYMTLEATNSYQSAVIYALTGEVVLMSTLVISGLLYRQRLLTRF